MKLRKLKREIEKHFRCHGALVNLVSEEVIGDGGRYIFRILLEPGTKESIIFNRAPDIKTALQLSLFQPFRDDQIYLAVSDTPFVQNSLWQMLASPLFPKKMWIPTALGYKLRGDMLYVDLAKSQHALYSGATYSGKTVGLKSVVVSIGFKQPVHKVNIIIIDTTTSGFDMFDLLPHLVCPIVKDWETAVSVISAVVTEMERRALLPISELRVLSAIVLVIDEFISLISKANVAERDKLIQDISSLLRSGRHAKIHCVLATQEAAQKDMLLNHTNLNARAAFRCNDFYTSKAIIGEKGAEKLSGKGALLFKSPNYPKPIFVQGAYMSDNDIKKLVAHIASQPHDLSRKVRLEISGTNFSQPTPIDVTTLEDKLPTLDAGMQELANVAFWVLGRRVISARQIEEEFHMGHRSRDIMRQLCGLGFLEEQSSNQPKPVLPQSVEDLSAEAMDLLTANGVSEDDIAAAFGGR